MRTLHVGPMWVSSRRNCGTCVDLLRCVHASSTKDKSCEYTLTEYNLDNIEDVPTTGITRENHHLIPSVSQYIAYVICVIKRR